MTNDNAYHFKNKFSKSQNWIIIEKEIISIYYKVIINNLKKFYLLYYALNLADSQRKYIFVAMSVFKILAYK